MKTTYMYNDFHMISHRPILSLSACHWEYAPCVLSVHKCIYSACHQAGVWQLIRVGALAKINKHVHKTLVGSLLRIEIFP
jgi:hypothetical protein